VQSIKKKKKFSLKNLAVSKRARVSLILLILGGTSLILGLLLFNPFIPGSEDDRAKTFFPIILLDVKKQSENEFSRLLDEIRDDEIGDLLTGKMPTTEEIFFAEWANDWFPSIDIPIYGPIIEEFGAEMVGDVDFDNIDPKADLNISSNFNPSDLTLEQCEILWNQNIKNSLVSQSSDIWFQATLGNLNSQERLQTSFNLTRRQLNLICNWVNSSSSGWIKNIAYRYDLKPILFIVFMISGSALTGFSLIIFGSLRKELKAQGLGIFKKKEF
jgi:hypothetical protein